MQLSLFLLGFSWLDVHEAPRYPKVVTLGTAGSPGDTSDTQKAKQPTPLPNYAGGRSFPTAYCSAIHQCVEDIFGVKLTDVVLEADTNPYLFYSVGATSTRSRKTASNSMLKQLMR